MARMTPLHLKAASGHRRGVKQLLEDGSFNVDCRTKKGETPLHLASAKGDPLVCERLIKAGADIYARRFDGRTPLHLATAADHPECVQTLLRFGSNPSLEDHQGRRAYDEVRSQAMAETYMHFFSAVRPNPAIVAHLEQQLLNREFEEITASVGDYADFKYPEQPLAAWPGAPSSDPTAALPLLLPPPLPLAYPPPTAAGAITSPRSAGVSASPSTSTSTSTSSLSPVTATPVGAALMYPAAPAGGMAPPAVYAPASATPMMMMERRYVSPPQPRPVLTTASYRGPVPPHWQYPLMVGGGDPQHGRRM